MKVEGCVVGKYIWLITMCCVFELYREDFIVKQFVSDFASIFGPRGMHWLSWT